MLHNKIKIHRLVIKNEQSAVIVIRIYNVLEIVIHKPKNKRQSRLAFVLIHIRLKIPRTKKKRSVLI